ncbi:unnamed protein product [Cuscuta epithymum]|uniref:Uncharacterized protein n=1 Tax=Cuscuta epithymum TaxID=186058 RepID=A0AAV0EM12_9ASTE|nr:unnamed protein product [Cuscuta epithymum]
MGLPEATPSPPHLYPQTIQLIKLYQAFIFSIPILFSIIVFLLLYLFYLKRRISIASTLPTTFANQTPMVIYSSSPLYFLTGYSQFNLYKKNSSWLDCRMKEVLMG